MISEITYFERLQLRHAELGATLELLRDRAWRADLPVGYKPLLSTSTVVPLRMSVKERRALNFEILETRLAIMKAAQKIHLIQWASVPAWMQVEVQNIESQINRFWVS